MTSFKLKLKAFVKEDPSRHSAKEVLQQILILLEEMDLVIIDLNNVSLTPSIADEIIGRLAQKLGAETFRQKIKIENATESQLALIRHVIARRLGLLPKAKG